MAHAPSCPIDRRGAANYPLSFRGRCRAPIPQSGEICISEALYTAPGVADLLTGHKIVEFETPLRGVEGNASVYRVVR
jgi:hypothetical protein